MKVFSLEWRFSFVAPNIEKRCHGNTNQRQCRKKQKGDSGEVLMHSKQNLEYNNIYTEVHYNKLCLPLNQKILNAVSKQTSASRSYARNSKDIISGHQHHESTEIRSEA